MRIFLLNIFFALCVNLAFGQETINQNKSQLASSFYRNGEFDKAAPLYLELFEQSNINYYYENYINCLLGMKDYAEAEKALKKQLRKSRDPNLQILLGFVYKEMGDNQKAYSVFDEIINTLSKSKGAIISVANQFFNKREFEYAEKTYLKGRELIEGEMFRANIAIVYAYTRNYQKMMEEYMFLLKENQTNLSSIQGRLSSLFQYDFDFSLRNTVKREILLGIQKSPEILAYNRLLIWYFVQEQNYQQALNHSIAIDKRTKLEESDIFNFSKSAAQIDQFEIALSGLNYLAERKPPVKILFEVRKEMVSIEYKRYIVQPRNKRENPERLVTKFETILKEQGYTSQTVPFAIDYAHFLAFQLDETEQANTVLVNALGARELTNQQRSSILVEQADLLVFKNQLWEATLLYAQIIESNRENPLGDEVKLKKARLGFYLGEIGWAKAQLDVIKASTSKLTANDAMELSLLIAAYYELDTLTEPLQLFARGDLLIFQNRDSLAFATYDSVSILFPGHPLADVILMRKASLFEREFDFEKAVACYSEVTSKYVWSTQADDALYKMAVIHETRLNQPEKAQELYKQILTNYPGSIYVADARTRFRILRGDPIESSPDRSYEDQFFRGEF